MAGYLNSEDKNEKVLIGHLELINFVTALSRSNGFFSAKHVLQEPCRQSRRLTALPAGTSIVAI